MVLERVQAHGQSQTNIPPNLFEAGGNEHVGQTFFQRMSALHVHLMSLNAQVNKYPSFMEFRRKFTLKMLAVSNYSLHFWMPLKEIYGSHNIILICIDTEHINTK